MLAWLLAHGDDVAAIPGTRSAARLKEDLAATNIHLTQDDLARIGAAIPQGAASGNRFAPGHKGVVFL